MAKRAFGLGLLGYVFLGGTMASALGACGTASSGKPDSTLAEGGNVLLDQDGRLEDSDGRAGPRFLDRYDLRVSAGDRLRVTLVSNDFDPTLQVSPPTGGTLSNDDFQGDRNRSQLEVLALSSGAFKVQVTSSAPNANGNYHVRVEHLGNDPRAAQRASQMAGQRRSGPQGVSQAGRGSHHQAPAGSGQSQNLTLNDLQRGDLSPSDGVLPTGEFADVYSVQVAQPGELSVQLESSDFDAFLVVRTPTGEEMRLDDSNGSTNPLLTIPDARPGTYTVTATTYRPRETGRYSIKVTQQRGGNTQAASAGQAIGDVRRGSLERGDATLRSGEFTDLYEFQWTRGMTVRLDALSNEFDTYLIVRAPSGEQQDNDDVEQGNRNAGLVYNVPADGTYRVTVTSYRAGEQGNYELRIGGQGGTSASAQAGAQPQTTQPAAGAQAATHGGTVGAQGVRREGSLARGDQQLQSGEFIDWFEFQLTPGQAVTVALSSAQFDPYLLVRHPSGRQEDNDDRESGVRDSEVRILSAEAGTYRIGVTSYRPGEAGSYSLQLGAGSGPAIAGPQLTDGQITDGRTGGTGLPVAGAPRIFLVSVGISDYPGGTNDLPECANDARRIAEVLRRQGLTNTQTEFLFTDAEASTGRVRQALERVAQEATEQDLFVFFYSGHGGQETQRTQDRNELDGINEYLVLHDGPMVDDELGRLLTNIRAHTSLVGLDACFAGGFAKDIITRPGIVGLFSSEEDVTSAVAGQFQAGGYLSHFLRLGFEGQADADPRDNVLTVGELTHYVWHQYGEHAADVRMSAGYQHLVVDRGAVRANETLWRLR